MRSSTAFRCRQEEHLVHVSLGTCSAFSRPRSPGAWHPFNIRARMGFFDSHGSSGAASARSPRPWLSWILRHALLGLLTAMLTPFMMTLYLLGEAFIDMNGHS
jgi:hypothetical protein